MIDWAGAFLSVLGAVSSSDKGIDPKYLAIKPRILSDDNILKGVAALRAVLTFIPPAALASPILGLGTTAFQIWKRIALMKEWDEVAYPPTDPNVMRLFVDLDPVLHAHFGDLTAPNNWDDRAISELEVVYHDFSFLTNADILKAKYPDIDPNYIETCVGKNKDLMQQNINAIEQVLVQAKQNPKVDAKLREALECLKDLFPAMKDWAFLSSDTFNEVLDMIDTVI